MQVQTTTILIALSFSPLLSAQDSPLPDQAQRIKDSYQAAVERATAPLTKTYVAELSKLKIEFTKKADLQGALAIERELLVYTANAQQPPVGAATASSESAMPILVGQAWHWTHGNYDKETTFHPDATFENIWFKGTWELKGKKLHLKYYPVANPDKKSESVFEANLKDGTYTGNDFDGNVVTLKR